jgi:polysaccharide pyruvyl transferase WcaK-like protein
VYAFHVGEMSLTTKLAISYAKQLPLVALARTRGGAAIHCGLGIRGGLQGGSADKVRVQVVKSILVACACVTWRDETSAHVMGIGAVEPDWAFGARDLRQGVDADLDRRTVAVALRHDRDRPSDEFVNAVQKYASDRGLEIVLTAQTERDLRPARENAARFGGRAIEWTDSALGVAEDNLRATYRGCHTVISNRLHGLVIAATEGATPIGLTTGDPEKLARTLDSAGLLGVCFDTRNAPEQDILSHLNAVDSKSADIRIAVKQAQSRLAQHADDLVELISSNAGGKPTASDRGR